MRIVEASMLSCSRSVRRSTHWTDNSVSWRTAVAVESAVHVTTTSTSSTRRIQSIHTAKKLLALHVRFREVYFRNEWCMSRCSVISFLSEWNT